MDETNKGLTIPDHAQRNCWWTRQLKNFIPDNARNNCWWIRPMKDLQYHVMYKATTDGWDRLRNPYQTMQEKTDDGWCQWRTTHAIWNKKKLLMDKTDKEKIHTRWCTKQLLMDDTNEGLPIPVDVQTTVDWRENWRNPCQMMYEVTVDGSDQSRTYHTRWCTKQMLMDETYEEFNSWWCTK